MINWVSFTVVCTCLYQWSWERNRYTSTCGTEAMATSCYKGPLFLPVQQSKTTSKHKDVVNNCGLRNGISRNPQLLTICFWYIKSSNCLNMSLVYQEIGSTLASSQAVDPVPADRCDHVEHQRSKHGWGLGPGGHEGVYINVVAQIHVVSTYVCQVVAMI